MKKITFMVFLAFMLALNGVFAADGTFDKTHTDNYVFKNTNSEISQSIKSAVEKALPIKMIGNIYVPIMESRVKDVNKTFFTSKKTKMMLTNALIQVVASRVDNPDVRSMIIRHNKVEGVMGANYSVDERASATDTKKVYSDDFKISFSPTIIQSRLGFSVRVRMG